VYEGFNYLLAVASISGSSILLQARAHEVWKTWCPLQTSYQLGSDPRYRCIPNGNGEMPNDAGTECALVAPLGQRTPMDCGKLLLCGGFSGADEVCLCNETGCVAPPALPGIEFNAQFETNRIIGNLRGIGGHLAYVVELRKTR
jgi:hypothetical protein